MERKCSWSCEPVSSRLLECKYTCQKKYEWEVSILIDNCPRSIDTSHHYVKEVAASRHCKFVFFVRISVARCTDLSVHVRISEIYSYMYGILHGFPWNVDFSTDFREMRILARIFAKTRVFKSKIRYFCKTENLSYFQVSHQ